MFIGSYKIDDLVTFYAQTQRFDTGAATDADSVPSYRIFEDITDTPLLTGSMALLDATNTAGLYRAQVTLSAANGFTKGACYCVRIAATVNSVAGATIRQFQIGAEVNATPIWDEPIEGSTTARQSQRLQNAVLGGKLSGGGTSTETMRDLADTKDRVVASVDSAGNRTALSRDLT